MHIVLLAADGYSPTQISRVLFCSRTTVYAIADRFAIEGRAAFCDRKRRGPAPSLDYSTHERIKTLVEEHSPTEHGWLRPRWSCSLLVLQLFRERALLLSRETVRCALHRLGFRWRRPPPGPPSKDPEQKRERLQQILKMLKAEGILLPGRDQAGDESASRVCLDAPGKQRRLPTPGTNRKVWISGALNFSTGRFHWVTGERKNNELFMKLSLEYLRRICRSHRQLHLAVDNDSSHTSGRVEEYVKASGQQLRSYPLQAWSPQSNPVEPIWWRLHEAG